MAVLKYAVCVAVHAVISVAAYNPLNPPPTIIIGYIFPMFSALQEEMDMIMYMGIEMLSPKHR